jgi:hypothetical protein
MKESYSEVFPDTLALSRTLIVVTRWVGRLRESVGAVFGARNFSS